MPNMKSEEITRRLNEALSLSKLAGQGSQAAVQRLSALLTLSENGHCEVLVDSAK